MSTLITVKDMGAELSKRGITLGVAESCTGGLLSSIITEAPGSSAYYRGAVVSYANEVKIKVLKVSAGTIKKFGAVSAETAREMAEGARKALSSKAALSITGIAGPGGGTALKPLGTVFIALSFLSRETVAREFHFKGSRSEIREQSAEAALDLLMHTIKEIS
ncbi:MAG: CinA family protein [Thermodesulfobacteriota bacterium]